MENLETKFWKVILTSLEQYSDSTTSKLVDIIDLPNGIVRAEKLITDNPSEEILLRRIEKELNIQ